MRPPPWLEALGPRAGPLLDAARRFSSEHPGAPAEPPPGAEGLVALCRAIDAWAERESASVADDEAFVEGAGSLLAAFLLERHTEATHLARGGTHRIRIGRDDTFDPFRAISEALEADRARPVILAHLERAEAEAAGRLGAGRALALLRPRLPTAHPVREVFEAEVRLEGEIELDIGRLLRATEGEGEAAVVAAVEALVSMLPGAERETPSFDDIAARLLPRLIGPAFLAELGPRAHGLLRHPIAGGQAEVALMVAYRGRARFVRADEPARWGEDANAALARALLNLAAASERAHARPSDEDEELLRFESRDGLDSARLLLPSLHDVLAPALGSPFLVAAPHRDTLIAGPLHARDKLMARARAEAARAPHPITDALFEVGPRHLRAADEVPEA